MEIGALPGFCKGCVSRFCKECVLQAREGWMKRVCFQVLQRVRSPGKGGMDKKGAFSNGKGGRDEWVYSPMVREGEGGFTKVEESKKPC